MVKKNKVVILGAGVSGLTLGYELVKAGNEVKIIEKNNIVGGLASSQKMGSYYIDMGPHLFHTAHMEIYEYWKQIVGDKLVEKQFYAGNYKNNKIYDYPLNFDSLKNEFSSSEFDLIKAQFQECLSNPDKLATSTNYYEYVRALCGDLLSSMFFDKYPAKLWGISTQNLSARFAPKRIAIRELKNSFHSGPGRFCGVVEGGCGYYSEALKAKFIDCGGELFLNSEVSAIKLSDKKIDQIVLSNDDCISVSDSIVVSTLPISKLTNLLGIRNKLYFRSVLLINVIVTGDCKFPQDYDWLYFDSDSINFHRVGVQTRFSRLNIEDNLHILCCEVAYNEFDKLNIDEHASMALRSLSELGFIDSNNVVDVIPIDAGPVYPGYYLGHELDYSEVNARLQHFVNLYSLGSLAEYSYSDLQVITSKAIDMATEINSSFAFSASQGSALRKKQSFNLAKEIDFGGHVISHDADSKIFTIAEIGLCHNGSVDECLNLIRHAKNAGFTSVKLQTFSKGRISKKTKAAKYYEETLDQEISLSDQLDELIFDFDQLKQIFEYSKQLGITIFSTPFDVESVNLLLRLNVPGFKISSMDISNPLLLDAVLGTNLPVILSTGMANLSEIEFALSIAAKHNNNKVMLLHCVSAYPCPIEDSNLSRIAMLRNSFSSIVGYSDHTDSIVTPSIAAAMGAVIIEKHVTSSRSQHGPDHLFSLEPEMQCDMINMLNSVKIAISSNGNNSSNIETWSKVNLKRSIYASKNISRGEVLTYENCCIKSPGDGVSPSYLDIVIGSRSNRFIEADTAIKWEDILNV